MALETTAVEVVYAYGDLVVNVGHGQNIRQFLVLKQGLSMVSTVWRNWFTGPAEQCKATELTLAEDDPNALAILFYLAHHRHDKIVYELSLGEISSVAKHCYKYDTVALARPHLSGWMLPHDTVVSGTHMQAWLWVAWVFDLDTRMKAILRDLVRTRERSELRAMTDAPPSLQDWIIKTRNKILDTIIADAYTLLSKVQTDFECKQARSNQPLLCKLSVCGAVMSLFREVGLSLDERHRTQAREVEYCLDNCMDAVEAFHLDVSVMMPRHMGTFKCYESSVTWFLSRARGHLEGPSNEDLDLIIQESKG